MIQVKEFLNYQSDQEKQINRWLKENEENIDVIDIKYSVSAFQAEENKGNDADAFSGVLIVYKTK